MGKKRYIQNIKGSAFKDTFNDYCCKGCGIIPIYKLIKSPNGGISVTMQFPGWIKIDDKRYCPLCSRNIKIKKILNEQF